MSSGDGVVVVGIDMIVVVGMCVVATWCGVGCVVYGGVGGGV